MKKGFTLIELLAVIAILAVLLIIAVPQLLDVVENTRIRACQDNELMMEKAAETYLAANRDLLPQNIGDTIEINLSDLQTNEFISNISDRDGICSGNVVVKKKSSSYSYIPYLNCTNYKSENPINDNLILHYKFGDEITAGGFTDFSSNNSHSTNFGVVSAADRFDNIDGATYYDGVNDYINIPLINNSNITVTFWRKNEDDTRWLLFKGQGNSQYLLAISTGNFYHSNVGNNVTIYEDSLEVVRDSRDGNWHYYAITGVDLSSWTELHLNYYSSWYYKGYIDNLKIYNGSLTADEIKHNYLVELNGDL